MARWAMALGVVGLVACADDNHDECDFGVSPVPDGELIRYEVEADDDVEITALRYGTDEGTKTVKNPMLPFEQELTLHGKRASLGVNSNGPGEVKLTIWVGTQPHMQSCGGE